MYHLRARVLRSPLIDLARTLGRRQEPVALWRGRRPLLVLLLVCGLQREQRFVNVLLYRIVDIRQRPVMSAWSQKP